MPKLNLSHVTQPKQMYRNTTEGDVFVCYDKLCFKSPLHLTNSIIILYKTNHTFYFTLCSLQCQDKGVLWFLNNIILYNTVAQMAKMVPLSADIPGLNPALDMETLKCHKHFIYSLWAAVV